MEEQEKSEISSKVVSLLYRGRCEDSELTFKALQSLDYMRTIYLSLLDVTLAFMILHILTYCFKKLFSTFFKRISKLQDTFNVRRIYTVFEVIEKLIKAFTRGVRSSNIVIHQVAILDLGIVQ